MQEQTEEGATRCSGPGRRRPHRLGLRSEPEMTWKDRSERGRCTEVDRRSISISIQPAVCHQPWMKAEQKAFQVASDLLEGGGLFEGKVDGNSDTLCWDGNEPNPWGSFGGGSR